MRKPKEEMERVYPYATEALAWAHYDELWYWCRQHWGGECDESWTIESVNNGYGFKIRFREEEHLVLFIITWL